MKIIQDALEKERKIKKLNAALVAEFDKARDSATETEMEPGIVIIQFAFDNIPEELRQLFKERIDVLWGEIANSERPKKYYYCKWMKLNEDEVTAKLIRNW